MANKQLSIALLLTAVDQMSSVVNSSIRKSLKSLKDFEKSSQKITEGFAMMEVGKKGFQFLADPIKEFARFEKDAARLRSNLMTAGGLLDKNTWQEVDALAFRLGSRLPGDTADFYRMFTVLRQGGLSAQSILNGTGAAAAEMAVALGESYERVADMSTSLKNATNVADDDMLEFFDVIARTRNLKVPLTDMEYAFARSANQLKFLGIQGLEASKDMAMFFAMFIRQGLSGETVGTNFSRILGEILNPEKYNAMNEAAREYGLTLDILDEKGNFVSVQNMVSQFDKLKGLSNFQIAEILKPLTGAEGLDDQLVKALSKGGVEQYRKIVMEAADQAHITDKTAEQLNTLDAAAEALGGTWDNLKAAFASSLKPSLQAIGEALNVVVENIMLFVKAHPKLSQFIATFIAIASAALYIAGVIKIVQGVIKVMRILNITMMSNPFILFATLAIAAVALIITYWDEIVEFFNNLWSTLKEVFSAAWKWIVDMFMRYSLVGMIISNWSAIKTFFSNLWEGVKNITRRAWEGIKQIFFNYTAIGLIISNWSKIKDFFSNLIGNIKDKFTGFITFVMSLGAKFFDAGKNIALSIWNGIKAMANKPIEAIKNIVQKMRDYLPFSPAKVGPFKDLHKIKIVETIAASIKSGPAVNAMRGMVNDIATPLSAPVPAIASYSTSNSQTSQPFVFSPTIHLYGPATESDANMLTREMKDQMKKYFEELKRQERRTNF